MAVKTAHASLTLRGNSVTKGIMVSNGQVPFSPHSGMMRHNSGLLATSSSVSDGNLDTVNVAIMKHGVVLVPCEDEPQRELVLVQQYSPGCGGKRWPSFSVELGPEIRKLSEAFTSGGSGGETWVLVSAKLGWAANIAAQFINERDCGGQTITYRPGLVIRRKEVDEFCDDGKPLVYTSPEEEPTETPIAAAMRKAGLI